ncbi:MAG: CheR family methyltransferase [Desulfobacteraceae bacterium]
MSITITNQEFELIRRFIEERCGILLGQDKAYLVENRLSNLAKHAGCSSFGEFYRKIRNENGSKPLQNAVLDAISTNETLWFRDRHPFRILAEELLPKLTNEIVSGLRESISVWSAGCSTGQEPYSIAITIKEYFNSYGCNQELLDRVSITATDVSASALAAAEKGVYSETAIKRGLSQDCLHRFFKKEMNLWHILPEIRRMITFRRYNLKDPPPRGFESFDVVFMRNVIIYFSDSFRRAIFDKVARMMSPGGCLFLGTGETLIGYTKAFETRNYKGGVYYRLVNRRPMC